MTDTTSMNLMAGWVQDGRDRWCRTERGQLVHLTKRPDGNWDSNPSIPGFEFMHDAEAAAAWWANEWALRDKRTVTPVPELHAEVESPARFTGIWSTPPDLGKREPPHVQGAGPDVMFLLRELLAFIHRDGGHHTEKVGLVRSALDAETKVTNERTELYAYREGALRAHEAAVLLRGETGPVDSGPGDR